MRDWLAWTTVALAGLALVRASEPLQTEPAPGAAQPVRKLAGHRGGITALAFHPEGKWLAVGAGNGDVRLWSLPEGQLLVRLSDPREGGARISHLGLSADGRYLSMTSRTSVVIWDVADLKKISIRYEDTYSPNPDLIGTITGDGKLCFVARREGNEGRLQAYSLVNRSLFDLPLPSGAHVVGIAAIPDRESTLAAAYCAVGPKGENGRIVLVGLGDPRLIDKDVPAPGSNDSISVSFSTDGKWLVVNNATQVSCWRVPGSQIIRGPAVVVPIRALTAAIGPGNRLAVAVKDEDDEFVTLQFFDLSSASPQPLGQLATSIAWVSAMAYSPDGALLAVADDDEGIVELYSTTTAKK
ncbi:MAG: WD40 repeat domain-containing protein [Gemmataceae bacterium]|nr:WD40 repeat domain-containing protein [Gemmataceae bacterium]MDW8241656.1 WD40 repeat domain-containing protein [Thermogemmata sp.]